MKYVMNDAASVADDAGTTRNIYPGAINQQTIIQESSCVWKLQTALQPLNYTVRNYKDLDRDTA